MENKTKESIPSSQKITPFEVKVSTSNINYERIISDFGSTKIDNKLLKRYKDVTGIDPHLFLRRGLYFSHRDFDKILDLYEAKKPFYIFTGRGPSKGAMHIGHMIPFMLTAHFQRVFKCSVVIQINDDEKYFWKDVELETLNKLAQDNIKEILSFGFDLENTFVFTNSEYISNMYRNVLKIQKRVTFNQVKSIFGVTTSSNIGKIAFPAIQAAPSFSSTFKSILPPNKKTQCLILCAVDQDPYFRMTRDVAPRLKELKPALLHCKFIPGLNGMNSKMSASESLGAILLSDKPSDIKKKVNGAVSGGQKTIELQRKLGSNLEKDVPFEYLKFFLEDDNALELIKREYSKGNMLTGEVKKRLINVLKDVLLELQKRRDNVNDDMVKKVKTIRLLKGI